MRHVPSTFQRSALQVPLVLLEHPQLADASGGKPRVIDMFPENRSELDEWIATHGHELVNPTEDLEVPLSAIAEARERAKSAGRAGGRMTAMLSRSKVASELRAGRAAAFILACRPNVVTNCDVQAVHSPASLTVQIAEGPRRGVTLDLELGAEWPFDRVVSVI